LKVLLLNSPIYDFAVYDFWMKPLGLLYLSSILKKEGHQVHLLDAANRFDAYFKDIKNDPFGRGKIKFQKLQKPEILKEIPGDFKRYGLPQNIIRERIEDFTPEVVMLTSGMTYWYLGLVEIKEIIQSLDYKPLFILGGIYASLLPTHAKKLGFERVYSKKENYIEELNLKIPEDFGKFPPPDYSNYSKLSYACLLTSLGCPFSCPYCASPHLYNGKQDKEEEQIIDEIYDLYRKGIKIFVFYDDALLIPEERFANLCEKIKKKKISASFFTPNGLHARFISKEVAHLMFEIGFKEPRISLETADENIQKKLSAKTTNNEFVKAVENLTGAGYSNKDIYTYLLAGAPGVDFESVEFSILYVKRIGVKISLAEFSPIPGTEMDEELPDPLLGNNTVYYHYKKKEKEMVRVKKMAKEANRDIG
jgi:radical SAM superfamily enzyme YgiQ (UPF0313 family)